MAHSNDDSRFFIVSFYLPRGKVDCHANLQLRLPHVPLLHVRNLPICLLFIGILCKISLVVEIYLGVW